TALFRLSAPQTLPPGRHQVSITFTVDGPGFGMSGHFALGINGRQVAEARIERTAPFKFAPEAATIGRDTGSPVSADYSVPFIYTGAIGRVTVDLGPVQPPRATGVE